MWHGDEEAEDWYSHSLYKDGKLGYETVEWPGNGQADHGHRDRNIPRKCFKKFTRKLRHI